jgi:hypothetical protein
VNCTVSVGISRSLRAQSDRDQAMREADHALYAASAEGPDRPAVQHPEPAAPDWGVDNSSGLQPSCHESNRTDTAPPARQTAAFADGPAAFSNPLEETGNMQRWMRKITHWGLAGLLCALPGWAAAQPAAGPPPLVLGQEELDPLLAPVALYPDTLLMQVLVASTYPLEVVAAERFLRANPGLKGEALTRAAADKGWDASVVSLLQFASVLTMMNDKLEWTQALGDAFLAQQADVMDTVQGLRARAQQAGNLQSTPQQTVVVQEKIIVIEPPRTQVVYVPYYNPTVVYGSWWWPARPPWYWVPPPMYRPPGFGQVIVTGIFWGVAISVRNEIWNDYRPSWRDRQINVVNNVTIINVNKRPRPSGQWQHDPRHRKGVAYRDDRVRDRVTAGSGARPAVQPPRPAVQPPQPSVRPAPRPGRGDDDKLLPRPAVKPAPVTRPSPGPVTRPSPGPVTRPSPGSVTRPSPFTPGMTRDVVKQQADRGRASREAVSRPAPRPAPAARPAAAAQPSPSRQAPSPSAR